MNSVVPAVESIHGINLYGMVLVAPGRLPKVRDLHVHVFSYSVSRGNVMPCFHDTHWAPDLSNTLYQ